MLNTIVYIVGFLGTGKLTVARALSRFTGARVVDNHSINNPIFALLDLDGVKPLPEGIWTHVDKIREAVLETIATLASPDASFIFTHDADEGNARHLATFESIRHTATRRGSRFLTVRLLCSEAELVRRVQSPERASLLKGISPLDVIWKSRHCKVLDPGSPDTLTLDITARTPEQTAVEILSHINH